MTEPSLQHFGSVPFHHGALLPVLKDYRRPNDKIAEWLRLGVLVPVKRGLYVRGESGRAPCLPLVANHLHGPSCVSLDHALAWHGLIPERVHEITSVCTGRSRVIDNALGRFSYTRLPANLYPLGITQVSVSAQETFLIASPAKALCDKVLLTPRLRATTRTAMRRFLFEDLRIDPGALRGLDLDTVRAYAAGGSKTAQLHALLECLETVH
ncbi:hypothetical protein [Thermomonas sp.]|uniref:type IV toxin-antitoxin system AbiEi family antitoxin domain-containing protein n=1 Tax=Thermomonas sp. TaxID=1971895 RepID=UPI0035ADA9D4